MHADRAHTANPEHDFLRDAQVNVRPVQAFSQFPVGGIVLIQVGVEQVERDASDTQFPDDGTNFSVREIDRDLQCFPLFIQHLHDGEVVKIERIIDRILPAILGDALREISFCVHQTNAN